MYRPGSPPKSGDWNAGCMPLQGLVASHGQNCINRHSRRSVLVHLSGLPEDFITGEARNDERSRFAAGDQIASGAPGA